MSNTLMTPEKWCEACENELADVCLQAIVNKQGQLTQQQEDSQSAATDAQNNSLLIAGTFLGGFLTGLILMAATISFTRSAASSKAELPPPIASEDAIKESALATDLEGKGMNSEIN